MESVDLGGSGLRVSRVGLGGNNFGSRIDFAETRAVVEAALDAGITFFDTAEVYGGGGGSERMLGEILEGRRHRVVIATKFGWAPERGHGAADYVRGAIEGSLERLRTDYVDLYYLHKPDPDTPIGETLGALDELVREGKVRAIGCSNVSAEQLVEADRVAREQGTARFTAIQNEYNLLRRGDDEDVLPLCRELGVGYVPYFPVASGLLTGKYRRGQPTPARFASDNGHTLLDLAISGLASTPGIAGVIAGATKPEQARANAAAGRWHLSDDQLAALAGV
jgi:aryl-alcohol dehydrogenase-like predicted oxidoreductase